MAIIKLGVMVVGIRGTVGGITFSANKSGPNARAWSRGANPNTTRQSVQRGFLGQLPAAWRALTGVQQAAWDTFAALPAQDLINSLGETYSISGFGWYMKINVRLLVMGRAIRAAVPTQARPSAPTVADVEFPFDVGQTALVEYASATFDPDFDLVLEVAQAASVGRLAAPTNFAEFVVAQDPNDTETGFMIPYVNRLGIGNDFLKGFVRLYRQTTDGLRSSAGVASFVAGDAANYAPGALDYNGTTDFALRGADLTGAADTKNFTIVAWFKIDGGDGSQRTILASQGQSYELGLLATNKIRLRLEDSVGAIVVDITSTPTYFASATWHSLMISVDTATQSALFFVDDAEIAFATAALDLDAIIDYTRTNHSIASRVGGANFWDGCLSSLWFSNVDALDFSDVAVRRIFISPAGNPLDLGAAGQLPTGLPPIVYAPDGDASNNVGAGGNYVNQSGTSACSDTP